ncbi:MAG: glycosyltransferase family 4 protein [Chloroflexota bacterium]|nr:glycosyltransferase family 4 protein [Chloroflexota bacterium]
MSEIGLGETRPADDRGLRVLMLDPNASTPPYDRALCAALARACCDVTLATSRFLYEDLPSPRGYRIQEAFFRLVGGRLGRRLGLADRRARIRRLLKAAEYPLDWALLLAGIERRRPDVVHVQWAVAPALDLRIWQRLRRLGIPIVYTAHNLLPHAARPGDAERYGRLYRAADALIVHGERAAEALAERWAVPPERVVVAPHGPLLEEEPELPRDVARRRLGLPLAAPLVLFAGLIEPYKGLDDLLAAFARLTPARPNARLVIAGKPNVPLAPIRADLARHGLAERTIIDARFLPKLELAAYLCAADVVALPYRAATSSGLLLAARRFGRPVVATAVGDLAELIVDGVSGLLVPPRDPAALAAALDRLLANPALAAHLGAEGQRTTLAEGGWDVATRRTLDAYARAARHAVTP